tara:strand:+ start:444 stop:731 length:288 start_codon:yes stop_codon:yes gene_type:complete
MKIKIFDSYVDFYNFLMDYEIVSLDPSFQAFVDRYNNINKGCGCRRNARIAEVVQAYRDVIGMLQVDPPTLEQIKIQGQYSEVQMYHEGVLLFKA